MKKTLIASAVALATFASAGVSAQEVNLPKIYGNIQLAAAGVDSDVTGSDISDVRLDDNGSTLGFLHNHEVAPGLTAFFKAEFEFDASSDTRGRVRTDEAYIGLKGDFGTILAGNDDTLYEWTDVTDLYEFLGTPTELTGDEQENRQIRYETPSFGGLTLGASVNLTGDEENYQFGAKYQLGDATTLALAVDSGHLRAQELADDLGVDVDRDAVIGFGLTHSLGDLTLAAQYETVGGDFGGDLFGVLGAYSLGQTTLMASYHFNKWDDADEDTHTFSLQALHNLSDSFYVYVEGQLVDNVDGADGDEEKTLALGATYVF